jgi:hypothetical protein
MDRWMDGWMDGYIHAYMHTYIHTYINSILRKNGGQKTQVKMLTIPTHEGNANQNHTKIAPHPC